MIDTRRIERSISTAGRWCAPPLAACLMVASTAYAQPVATADSRPFTITPRVGIQTAVTDNVLLTEDDRKTDSVTRVWVGVDATAQSEKLVGNLNLEAAYDLYGATQEYNGWSFSGLGNGSYTIVPNLLSINASGALSNGNATTFGSSAIDRAGVEDRVTVGNFVIGPRLTTTLGDWADLEAEARYSYVSFEADNSSPQLNLPSSASIGDVVALIDTRERFNRYQFVGSAQYVADENDYRMGVVTASGFFTVAPAFRVIGRVGYDRVEQPGIVDISSPIWSVGVEWSLNERSRVTIEGGERYEEPAYAASADFQISEQFYLSGRYYELIQTAQLGATSSFLDFINQSETLPDAFRPQNFTSVGTITEGTSLNKTAELDVIYQWPTQSVRLSAFWQHQDFLDANGENEAINFTVGYNRSIRPDLSLNLEGSYGETYDDLFGDSREYRVAGTVLYRLRATTDIAFGYAYSDSRLLATGGEKIYENVVFASLLRRF